MGKTHINLYVDSEILTLVKAKGYNLSQEVNTFLYSLADETQEQKEITKLQKEKENIMRQKAELAASQILIERQMVEAEKKEFEAEQEKQEEVDMVARCFVCNHFVHEGRKSELKNGRFACNDCVRANFSNLKEQDLIKGLEKPNKEDKEENEINSNRTSDSPD